MTTLQEVLERQQDLNLLLQDEIKLLEEIVITIVSDSEYLNQTQMQELETSKSEYVSGGLVEDIVMSQQRLEDKILNLNNIRRRLHSRIFKEEVVNPYEVKQPTN